MSSYIWFMLLAANYLCLLSLKSLVLGLFIFICRLCVRFLISIYSLSWYSLIFFLVYIGGLLVLFIYVSSLKFKPVFYFSKMRTGTNIMLKAKIFFFLFCRITRVYWKFNEIGWGGRDLKKFSLNIFNWVEVLFLIKVGVLLLVVLWVITKLSFRNRRALRPFYG